MTRVKRKIYPRITFIIPTLNASAILPKCLEAIRSQNYPQQLIEIIVADGGSTDETINIARHFKAKVIDNPEILHEPGKDRASRIAVGKLLFFTDADNILSHTTWLQEMVGPYLDDQTISGYLPQTIPAPDSNGLDRYLGYLVTDPFTWFIYGQAVNPRYWHRIFTPIKKTNNYQIYKLSYRNPPMFGLSQGVGTLHSFNRENFGHADDILSGIKLIKEGGTIAYVPSAGVYHYHVSGLKQYIKKYSWRIKNNFQQNISGMGLVNRLSYFSWTRKARMLLFVPYAFSIIFPFLDALRLMKIHKDPIMLWHVPATISLAAMICIGPIFAVISKKKIGTYA